MSRVHLGVCSQCGGSVCIPTIWHGVIPPVPQCTQCHAVARPMGPVIETIPVQKPAPLKPLTESIRLPDGRTVRVAR